ncbi:MAG: glycerol-3-phosphate 1-O-acyltransferase PlsY [Opitutaceae bacterium]
MVVTLLIVIVAGYLLGSLPFGYLVARAKGVNIFAVGSKSPGATNVRRVLGHGPGNLVTFLDAMKGAVAAGWPTVFFSWKELAFGNAAVAVADVKLLGVVGLAAALVGHSFSCFTHFKGGKGVATGAGGFLVLFPLGAIVAAAVWGLTLAVTRYVSLASMLAAVALTLTAWLRHTTPLILGACTSVMVFVILRHRANISRLFAGAEHKVGQKSDLPKS